MRTQVTAIALSLFLFVASGTVAATATQAKPAQSDVGSRMRSVDAITLLQPSEISAEERAAAQAAAREIGRMLRPRHSAVANAGLSELPTGTGGGTEAVAAGDSEEADSEPESGPPLTIDYALADKVQYSNAGISLQAPDSWQVVPGTTGIVFNITVPGTDFVAELQSSAGPEIPGVSAVVLYRDQPEALVRQIDESAEFLDVAMLATSQQLPVVKIVFDADFATGALYIVSPGADAYLLIAAVPGGGWEEYEGGVDLLVESMFFAPSLITLTTAESGDLRFGDAGNRLEVVVPEEWQVTDSNLETLPLIVIDPDFRFVGALGYQPGYEEEFGIILDSISASDLGELDDVLVSEAIADVLVLLDLRSEDLELDATQSQIFVNESGTVTMRAGGTAILDEEMQAPVVIYVSPRTGGVVGLMVFGEIDQALQEEGAYWRLWIQLRCFSGSVHGGTERLFRVISSYMGILADNPIRCRWAATA